MIEFMLRSVVIGVGATAIYDVWGRFVAFILALPNPNWAMPGRWFSYMAKGQFIHVDISAAAEMPAENAVGWTMHYLVGIIYAAILIAIWGMDWARRPTLLPALIVGFVTILAGWFLMSPAMGGGIASANMPNSTYVRMIQLVGHGIFGIGLYLIALAMSKTWSVN
ncbi:DUF2938 family protein [Pseudomonas simiae]|uniref:DUF2938 family protein n=1 Tax=Pseudomonas simiae TaxID=321846 RepID=UPI003D6A9377